MKVNRSVEIKSPSNQTSIGRSKQATSGGELQERKSVAQGKCDVIILPQDISKFLDSQNKNRVDYVTVSCNNTSVKNDYTNLPPEWVGWFPKFMFSEKSNTEVGQKVEINTESQQEESDSGSYTEVTFSGTGLNSVFQGALIDIKQETLNKNVSSVKISNSGQRNSSVYLFLPKLSNEIPKT